MSDSWRPLPLRQFIVKLHSRCNLACDYCYVYTMADQRWRSRPRVMTRSVIDQVAVRIGEHVRVHALSSIEIVLHGGEPLLAGAGTIRHLVSRVRAEVDGEVRFAMQTNGTLLDSAALDLLLDLGVRVSVSVDGTADGHDQHRRTPAGAGSYATVRDAVRNLGGTRYRSLFAGLLCTVDLRNDPVETYEALLDFEPPMVDFLLPHGNWTTPPPCPAEATTSYSGWMIAVFEQWYRASTKRTSVRMFEEIINVLLGGASRVEGIGISPLRMVVIETDGSIEQSDILASAYEGAAATGLHVRDDPIDAVLTLPATRRRQLRLANLPAGCRSCPVRTVCGSGMEAHRYRAGAGFDNPSVYCPDLFRLISHVRDRVAHDVTTLRTSSR